MATPFTQDTVGGDTEAGDGVGGKKYPDYSKDEEIFGRFLREHRIEQYVRRRNDDDSDDDDDDDSMMNIPTALPDPDDDDDDDAAAQRRSCRVRKVDCYLPHLLRIQRREFYESHSSRTFIVEVPLDELYDWNAITGGDLAARAAANTGRYVEVFCTVIDQIIANSTIGGSARATVSPTAAPSASTAATTNDMMFDTVDILQQQRVAQHAAHLAQRRQQQTDDSNNNNNHYTGNNNLAEENNNNEANNANNSNPSGAIEDLPPALLRRYELRILPRGRAGSFPPFVAQHLSGQRHAAAAVHQTHQQLGVSLRQVGSAQLGKLVTLHGMVVRVSDVKPYCQVAAYSCDACGSEVFQVITARAFLPARLCPVLACLRHHKRRATLHLQTRGSRFVKMQEVKLQELPHQVPMGHVPRSLTIVCRGELTRLVSPGDVVTVDGIFLPLKVGENGSAYQALRAGLISTTFCEAQNVIVHKKSYDEMLLGTLSAAERVELDQAIRSIATSDDPIGTLSRAIAPEIFGHADIKRSLLLQLVGGCTRTLPDGMRIRGDVNILIMGDPGTAKSQLLKHVAAIAPRGVYTTGKGSSGVGLTAAVIKDMATGEMALEGGALVLADNGIACIDEFDKMQESDRTAIHEVMEQQTVSIAKAGIVATLNARAAVLAAANPLYSRYNRSKSLSENINLPNSLLSRFDLLFLVLDTADVDRDMALARHVTLVHQNEGVTARDRAAAIHDTDGEPHVAPRVLREYIARARQHHPVMPPDVAPYVVEAYVSLRMQDRPGSTHRARRAASKQNDQTVMTARQLLSILRLSQALARLRFSDFVAREDVDEAIRLTHMSKASLNDDGNGADGNGARREDVLSRIFHTLRDYATARQTNELELQIVEAMVLRKGFTTQQLQSCLEEYEALQVLQVNESRTHVYFLDET